MKDRLIARWALVILIAPCPKWSPADQLDTPVRFQIDVDSKPLGGQYEPFYTSKEYKAQFFGYWRKLGDWRLTVWYEQRRKRGGWIRATTQPRYPAPEPGEILPMFGRLYRATGRRPAPNLTFVRLTEDEIPMGYDVQRKGTWIVPLLKGPPPPEGPGEYIPSIDSPNGYLDVGPQGSRLDPVRFVITAIGPDPEDTGKYVATGKAGWHVFKKPATIVPLTLRVRKTYSLEGRPSHDFTVRRIVPRDDKLKTMGWVELEFAWRKDDS